MDLDAIDLRILSELQQDGRLTNSDLAQRVGLAAPTVLRRVKLLEERNIIQGYAAQVNPLALGLTVTAFILVETMAGCDLDEAIADIAAIPGVIELHRLIGEWCLLLKVRTASPQTLEDLVYRTLRRHPSVRRTQTTLATSAVVETAAQPVLVASSNQEREGRP
jgi:Lrp/AsnC family transcriptional regulator, leucine-responsive regulatory protein